MTLSTSPANEALAPIAGFGRSRGGQSINLVDWPEMRAMADAIRTGTMNSYAR